MPHSGALEELIRAEIRRDGPLPFARYMQLALYEPELGYYRKQDPFGRNGDFYTAEQLQPVFGELLSGFVEQLANELGAPDPFHVLELGAGRFEMGNALRQWAYLGYDWTQPDLPTTWSGLIFANEFFDALPVHLLQKEAESWVELFVTEAQDALRLQVGEPGTPELLAYAEQYGDAIPDGGLLEACLEMEAWLQKLSHILEVGHLLLIDYGVDSRELVRFPQGTLLAYRKHRAHARVLDSPGSQDITAHVNFTWLLDCARRAGFHCEQSTSLGNWTLSVWHEKDLTKRWAQADQQWRLQWKQIVFGLGETFRVVHLKKLTK